MISLAAARDNRVRIDWSSHRPAAPRRPGRTVFADYDLAELAHYIDWSPFFQTWDLTGSFPKILDDPVVGTSARGVYADAVKMLRRIVEERWLRASGVISLLPAASRGDDIVIFRDERREQVAMVWHTLRQQSQKPADRANLCLADFVAPLDAGVPDWVGAFAVTAGLGCDERVAAFEAEHDDYSAIMLKALADRLAEAFAERLHQRVRREFWGYAPDEHLDNDSLIAEKYRGIRPAPGYPACPDHTAKGPLFELLKARAIGMELTESFAMTPTAAVSGFYLAHPQAQYFAVGKIGEDQAKDYAARREEGMDVTERWLAPVLGYEAAA
jgi:5-methyltetrahydrofolate--homocysteine methyltransferase